MSSPRALDGIRVIDMTQVMAGPFCCMLLGDMGADVIKVEPPEGESTRHMEFRWAPGVSAPFLAVNRNKRGMTLDLKRPEGVAVLKRLAATADVLVENYRPGVTRRLGIDWETLRQINPRLVYCSISGFGQTGPYAGRGGYDLIAQGMSGIMSATGSPDGPPVKVGVPVADLGGGLFGVVGILCAIRARRVTGRGQLVDTSLFEAGLALSAWEATEYWYTGQIPKRLGTAHRLNAPYQAFRASDGHFTVGAANSRLWPRFAKLLGLESLVGDPRFAGVGDRVVNQRELERLIESVTVHRAAGALAGRVRGRGHSRGADLHRPRGPRRRPRGGARHGAGVRVSRRGAGEGARQPGEALAVSGGPSQAGAAARRGQRRGAGGARLRARRDRGASRQRGGLMPGARFAEGGRGGPMIREVPGRRPRIHADAYVDPMAQVIGDVTIAEGASVWPFSVLRGDQDNHVTLGRNSNVQDNSVLHVTPEFPCVVGAGVTIGHRSVVHACTIMDNVRIGIGAVVLSGAVVEEWAQVAAGALVPEGKVVPAGWLVMGVPAKPVRKMDEAELEDIRRNALDYVALWQRDYLGNPSGWGAAR